MNPADRFDRSPIVRYVWTILQTQNYGKLHLSIMNRFFLSLATFVVGMATVFCADESLAQQPDWSPTIIVRGEERQQIRATPIQQRPNRPLHFYGNTVRRIHHRGTPLPSFSEPVALPARVVTRR